MTDVLIWVAAVVVLAGIVGWLLHWYVLPVCDWPLVGSCWRHNWKQRSTISGPTMTRDADDYWIMDVPDVEEEPDEEQWPAELHQMNTDLAGSDQSARSPARPAPRIYPALSDDPELVVWDAKQQASRCWEIVHVEFPRLRAAITEEYRLVALELAA